MKRLWSGFVLFLAAGLAPLVVLWVFAWRQYEAEETRERAAEKAQNESLADVARQVAEAATRTIVDDYSARWLDLLKRETAREYSEFQQWYAPATMQAQAPSVVLSPLATAPLDPFVGGYFQFVSDGQEVVFQTPHSQPQAAQLGAPLGQVAQAQFMPVAPAPNVDVQALQSSAIGLLRQITSSDANAALPNFPPVQAKLWGVKVEGVDAGRFASNSSSRQPQDISQLNSTIYSNTYSQQVLENTQSATVERQSKSKAMNRAGSTWEDLPIPGDPDAKVTVQVGEYRMGMVTDGEGKQEWLAWRSVRTPLTHIIQGFRVDARRILTEWLTGRQLPAEVTVANAALKPQAMEGTSFSFPMLELLLNPYYVPDPAYVRIESRYASLKRNSIMLGASYAVLLFMLAGILGWTISRRLALAQQQQDFVAAVSHELRTPLSGIRLYAEMMAAGEKMKAESERTTSAQNGEQIAVPNGELPSVPQSTIKYASRIVEQQERLMRLIEMILLSSRIERDTLSLTAEEGELSRTLSTAVEAAMRIHPGREVVVSGGELLPRTNYDHAAAERLFFNLLDNALKYSSDKGTPVTVKCEREGQGVRVTIEDKGCGMSRQEQRHAFKRFWRARKAGDYGAGTGLGLWLVREYASRMGWRIELDSREGEGTRASVIVPAA